MEAELQAYVRAGDTARLGTALTKLATLEGVEAFPDWREITLRGAEAAQRGDTETVRATCKDCHKKHRKHFRQTRRTMELKWNPS